MWIVGRCIVYTGIRLLLTCPFISSFFFIFNFQTLKFFVTLFSWTVRPRRLRLGTHVDSRQMYCVYRNQAAAAYWSPYFSIFFLSNFQTLKFFALFSGTVRPRRLKLGTQVDSGWMYGVYQNQAAAAYLFLYFFFLQYSNIKVFVTLFSGTVRPRKLIFSAHIDNGWMYRVYQNQAAGAYLFLYFFIFLPLQFSNIKMFLSHLSQELWGLEGWNVIPTWTMGRWIMYTESFHNIFLQN